MRCMWLRGSYGHQANQIMDDEEGHVKVMGPRPISVPDMYDC